MLFRSKWHRQSRSPESDADRSQVATPPLSALALSRPRRVHPDRMAGTACPTLLQWSSRSALREMRCVRSDAVDSCAGSRAALRHPLCQQSAVASVQTPVATSGSADHFTERDGCIVVVSLRETRFVLPRRKTDRAHRQHGLPQNAFRPQSALRSQTATERSTVAVRRHFGLVPWTRAVGVPKWRAIRRDVERLAGRKKVS